MKVAICGAINPDFSLIPNDVHIWTVARKAAEYHRATRAYELHTNEEHQRIDQGFDCEVWSLGNIPDSLLIPMPEILFVSGIGLNCSLSWMIAHAVIESVSEIQLHGCPLSGDEYLTQLPGVCYWMGIAAAHGIEVKDYNKLIPPGIYGEWRVE